jgi:hypothetical protein
MTTDAIFDDFSPRHIAKAVAASNQILIEALIASGAVDRATLQRSYRAKAQQLIGEQLDTETGQLLMLLGGAGPRSTQDE